MRLAAFLVSIGLAASGCASSGAVPSPFPRPGTVSRRGSVPPAPITSEDRSALVAAALSLQGAPYRDGGADPTGFDCSGFVAYVFGGQGLFVPRTVSDQYQLGASVAKGTLEPGDLVFFSTTVRGPSHVGIAVSAEQFVHAPSSRGVVRVESLTTPYWSSRFTGARRLFAEADARDRSP